MPGGSRVLRRRREIDELFRSGRRCRGRLMTVTALSCDGCEGGVLFAVGKRVGKAVVRNRVRRRMREAYRALAAGVRSGARVAFVAHPPAASVPFGELLGEMGRLLGESGLLAADGMRQGGVP